MKVRGGSTSNGGHMTMSSEVAAADRRKTRRRATSEVVKLELNDGAPGDHPGLLVTDMSDGGLRLFAQNVEVPSTFAVIFSESGIRRNCRMVWRIGPEVGVEFIDQAPGTAERRATAGRRRTA